MPAYSVLSAYSALFPGPEHYTQMLPDPRLLLSTSLCLEPSPLLVTYASRFSAYCPFKGAFCNPSWPSGFLCPLPLEHLP